MDLKRREERKRRHKIIKFVFGYTWRWRVTIKYQETIVYGVLIIKYCKICTFFSRGLTKTIATLKSDC
jgi:hypothetical protein